MSRKFAVLTAKELAEKFARCFRENKNSCFVEQQKLVSQNIQLLEEAIEGTPSRIKGDWFQGLIPTGIKTEELLPEIEAHLKNNGYTVIKRYGKVYLDLNKILNEADKL